MTEDTGGTPQFESNAPSRGSFLNQIRELWRGKPGRKISILWEWDDGMS